MQQVYAHQDAKPDRLQQVLLKAWAQMSAFQVVKQLNVFHAFHLFSASVTLHLHISLYAHLILLSCISDCPASAEP